MNKVHLVGDIGDKFGHEWNMNVSDYGEIIRLIDCQREGFKEYLINSEQNEIGFTIQRGKEYINDETELLLNLNEEDIIITAVPMGAGKGGFLGSGFGKIILGTILIVIGYYMPTIFKTAWGTATGTMVPKWAAYVMAGLKTVGTSLITQGVEQFLAGDPTKGRQTEGYLFTGGINAVVQGQPVPLLYGEMLIPGAPIMSTMTTKKPSMNFFEYSNYTSPNYSMAGDGHSGVAAALAGGQTLTSDEINDLLKQVY